MDKKNIAFFNIYKIWGGGEKWHFEMASNLHSKGHNVVIFSPIDGELALRAKNAGIKVIDIKWTKYSYFNPVKIIRLFLIILKLNLDIVLFNSFLDIREASLWFWLAGVKRRIFRVGMPIAPKNKLIFKLSFRYGLTHINYISVEIKNVIENIFDQSLKKTKKTLFTNGIDVSLYKEIKEERSLGPIVIGNCVRLAKQKRLDLFLEVVSHFKNNESVQFKIAGEGEEKESLERIIQDKGLEGKVKLVGHVESTENFYPNLDLVLFTSAYEGTARTILESMACGVPVICFDISSMREIVENGYNGYRVPAFNTTDCVNLINNFIENKNELKQLSSNCRKFIQSKFNKEIIFQNWENLILESHQ